MKVSLWFGTLFAAALAFTTATARERAARPAAGESISGQEAAAQTKAQREALFKELDADGDGALSKKEVGSERAFTQMDLNKDGKVTMPEYNTAMVKKAGTSFQNANANQDNALTAEEISGALKKRLEERKAGK